MNGLAPDEIALGRFCLWTHPMCWTNLCTRGLHGPNFFGPAQPGPI